MAAFTRSYAPRTFKPGSTEPFKVSRSKIDLFLECPRCFYLDARLGIKRPSGPPFTLNVAVDALLKKEFDTHRAAASIHPLLKRYGLTLIPWKHPKLSVWRENFTGVQVLHQPTNLLMFGAVDDLWVDDAGVVYVVDYKATSKEEAVTELSDTRFHNQYRRQMEVYQWLLRGNEVTVSDTGYFVYVNGRKDREAFDGRLEFDVNLIAYTGSDGWVEKTIVSIHQCLMLEKPPLPGGDCEFCTYRESAGQALREKMGIPQEANRSTPIQPPKKASPRNPVNSSVGTKSGGTKSLF